MTANGSTDTTEVGKVYVKDLDMFVGTPAVLYLGKLCEENGCSHEWKEGLKNLRKLWWNQDGHLLDVTAEVFQKHLVRKFSHQKHQREKHNLFKHFPKDPNCGHMQACERWKSSLQTEFTKSHAGATKLADISTADHNVFKDERGSRNKQKYAFVFKIGHTMNSRPPMQNKSFSRNGEKSTKGSRSQRKSKVHIH